VSSQSVQIRGAHGTLLRPAGRPGMAWSCWRRGMPSAGPGLSPTRVRYSTSRRRAFPAPGLRPPTGAAPAL